MIKQYKSLLKMNFCLKTDSGTSSSIWTDWTSVRISSILHILQVSGVSPLFQYEFWFTTRALFVLRKSQEIDAKAHTRGWEVRVSRRTEGNVNLLIKICLNYSYSQENFIFIMNNNNNQPKDHIQYWSTWIK